MLSLDYVTSVFYYIPKAALAAVIIMAVVPLFDTKIVRTLWHVKSTYVLVCQREVIDHPPTASPGHSAGCSRSSMQPWEVSP